MPPRKTLPQKAAAKDKRKAEGQRTRAAVEQAVREIIPPRQTSAKPIGFHPVTGEPIYAATGPRPKPEKKR